MSTFFSYYRDPVLTSMKSQTYNNNQVKKKSYGTIFKANLVEKRLHFWHLRTTTQPQLEHFTDLAPL